MQNLACNAVSFTPRGPATGSSHEPLRGRRVLLVDGDDLVLQGARGLLESWGCNVVTAASVAQALERLSGRAPDLVVPDFQLKGGEQVTDLVAAMHVSFGHDLSTILVSAMSMRAHESTLINGDCCCSISRCVRWRCGRWPAACRPMPPRLVGPSRFPGL